MGSIQGRKNRIDLVVVHVGVCEAGLHELRTMHAAVVYGYNMHVVDRIHVVTSVVA